MSENIALCTTRRKNLPSRVVMMVKGKRCLDSKDMKLCTKIKIADLKQRIVL